VAQIQFQVADGLFTARWVWRSQQSILVC
jgi:hypothetical protein